MAFSDSDFGKMPSLAYRGNEILVSEDGGILRVVCPSASEGVTDTLYSESAIEVPADFIQPAGSRFIALRELFSYSSEGQTVLAGRMRSYLNFLRDFRFCPSCGTPLERCASENALFCPSCRKTHYPRISPCVIAVIEKGDKMLLLRHKLRNQDIFACLAGFVEVGESLEYALCREVKEETGLDICNIRYAGSQAWPFPDQLMVGFYADYLSGEISIQEDEISEAAWFSPDNIPASPRPGSISWKLIHHSWSDI